MQKNCKNFANQLQSKQKVMRGFQKGITLDCMIYAKMSCKKICKNFANELQSKQRVMRGFQKGITLGGRTSGSALKVIWWGGVGWWWWWWWWSP